MIRNASIISGIGCTIVSVPMKEKASGRSASGSGASASAKTSGSQPLRTTCMRSAASG